MENCLFCKIVRGEIPSFKIYEDEYTYAFLDISKDCDGHTLVISKQHYTNILDIESDVLFYLIQSVKKISNYYVNNCGYEGVNIINSSNEAAEQVIMHAHIHIIPRKKDDNMKVYPKLPGSKLTLEESFQKHKMN